jgi:hypothetical protein
LERIKCFEAKDCAFAACTARGMHWTNTGASGGKKSLMAGRLQVPSTEWEQYRKGLGLPVRAVAGAKTRQ